MPEHTLTPEEIAEGERMTAEMPIQSDAERIAELEKRQDIAEEALEELISMVLEV